MGARTARRALRALGWAAMALLIVPTAAGWVGLPMLSYAKSGSMEPVIMTGEAYLSNPFARGYEAGDIAVFESEVAGGYAVHRLIAREGDGWITQGDANPQTDQEVGEPLVHPDRIHARVLVRDDGSVVTVPVLGAVALQSKVAMRTLSLATGQPAWVLALALACVGGALLVPGRERRRAAAPHDIDPTLRRAARPRSPLGRVAPWHVRWAGAAFVLAAAVFAAHAAQETVHMSLVVTDSPPPGSVRSALPGETLPRDLVLGSGPLLSSVAIVELPPRVALAEGESAEAHIPRASSATLHVVQTAGDEQGLQEDAIVVWHYPPILPPAQTRALHDAAPGGVILALGLLGASLAYAGASATQSMLLRAPTRPEARP